jgi:hypothetical protein
MDGAVQTGLRSPAQMLTAAASSTRTRVEHRAFICKGDGHHHFSTAVKLSTKDDGTKLERTAVFLLASADGRPASWQPLPLCPTCEALSEEESTYNPGMATVPESERFVAFLSPDGKRLAVPGDASKPMREQLHAWGYRKVTAHSMRDMDRLATIREGQTGNTVDPEMNYEPETRQWREDAPYDPDDMTSPI